MSAKANKPPTASPTFPARSPLSNALTPDLIRKSVEAELAGLVPQAEECPICCKPFKAGETTLLPCGHTVCRPCLNKSPATTSAAITCLVCNTSVSGGVAFQVGVDGLPRNPFIEQALAVREPCAECVAEDMVTDESMAVVRCNICVKDLCHVHETIHKRRAATKDHQLFRLIVTAMSEVCQQHTRPLDIYCVSCSIMVCVGCTLQDGKHPSKTHHSALLSEHFATLTTALSASKLAGARSQLESVKQIAAVRSAVAAVEERGGKLAANVSSAFDVLEKALRARKSAVLEQVAKLTTEERAVLESSIGAERRRWLALQGGIALTDQLLAPTTTPVRIGQLSRMVTAHMAVASRLPVGKPPQVEEMVVVVDPSVEQVLRTVGRLQFLRPYGPKCTAAGAGLSSTMEGVEETLVVTAVSRSDDRVRVGGDRVEGRLVNASIPSGDATAGTACTVVDKGDGTYTVSYKSVLVGAYRLHLSMNAQPIQGSPFAVTVTERLFTFGGKLEYDNRGIIYYLATDGGKRPWTNPQAAGMVEVTGGLKVYNNVTDFVNNTVGTFHVGGSGGAWIALNLKGRRVQPTGYMLSYYKGGKNFAQPAPRNWRLEGSNDGRMWTTLKTHSNDLSLDEGKEIAYWPLDQQLNAKWSYFRLLSNEKTSYSDVLTLHSSCMELYGTLLNP